jgi:serine/threonine protein kinase
LISSDAQKAAPKDQAQKADFAEATFVVSSHPNLGKASVVSPETALEKTRPASTAFGSKIDPREETYPASKPQTKIGHAVETSIGSVSALTIGSNLGPYRLIKLLGQGGMGSVYLAKQTSLDRDVALKVINAQLSDSPKALARFTREAYAAAQLVHPNVVQVYDMGDDRGNCYFSMELVLGRSLAEFVVNEKKLDPEQAASFILHAARGLAHAHAAGMVHRDIKPGNLLVDGSGAVKVADLGLVKVPDQDELDQAFELAEMSALSASQDLTRFGSAIGTPYYMAPEQAKNAVAVDHRADIYSLGCTFYVLLTGKKPFDGKTFEEIVSKHSTAPLIEPSQLVERVPASLSGIVSKMMAKNPKERYQSLNDLIPELEEFLGIRSLASFTPDDEDVKVLEREAKTFNGAKLSGLRSLFPAALVAGCLLLAFIVLISLSWQWASGFLIVPVLTGISYFLVSGIRDHGVLFSKARELAFDSGLLNWVKWILAGLVLVVVVYLIGLVLPWLLAAFVGVGLAIAYYLLVDKPIAEARKRPIAEIESLLKKMRTKGMDEKAIASFVARYSGRHWEELFENLFGYDNKRKMRDELAQTEMAKSRPKFRPWRDRFYDDWCCQLKQLKSARDRKHLENVEFAGLKAEGLSVAEAREQAGQMADAMVDFAAQQKIAALEQRIAELDPKVRQEQKRQQVKKLLADARSGKYRQEKTWLQRMEPMLNLIAGSYTRFLMGCLLLVGSMVWAKQNGILDTVRESASKVQQAINQPTADPKLGDSNLDEGISDKTQETGDKDATTAKAEIENALTATLNRETTTLRFPLFGRFFHSFDSMVAGLILLASAFIFGWRMSLFALPAAFIAMFGSGFVRDLENIPTIHSLSAVVAASIFVTGIVFGRSED